MIAPTTVFFARLSKFMYVYLSHSPQHTYYSTPLEFQVGYKKDRDIN
jgi:hypothetical protein